MLFRVPGGADTPLVGADGTIYALGADGLDAFDPAGDKKWGVAECCGDGPPVLAPDGKVFAMGIRARTLPAQTSDTEAIGISPSGNIVWRIQPFGLLKGNVPLVTQQSVWYFPLGYPNADPYLGLNVISPEGKLLHRFKKSHGSYVVALSRSGVVYTRDTSLAAMSPQGRLLWRRALGDVPTYKALMVNMGGEIITNGQRSVLAFSSSGRPLWTYSKADGAAALGERADGVIIAAGPRYLDAVNRGGKRLWRVALGKPVGRFFTQPSLTVDAVGTAYVGTQGGKLWLLSSQGKLLARASVGPGGALPAPTTALRPDGTLVVASTNGSLSVFGP